MHNVPAPNIAALRKLIDGVTQQSQGMMMRLAERGRQTLLQSAGKTRDLGERNILEQAAGLLLQHAAALAERYPLALHEGFLAALQDQADPAGPSTTLKFDELELMDERQVQESVDAARGLQLANMAVESELGELSALVSSALGHKQVQVESNPIRPEVFVQALRSTLNEARVESAVSHRWGHVMGPLLGQELRKLFQSMRVQLQAQGVRPVGYAVLRTPQGGGGTGPRGGAGAPGAQQAPDPRGLVQPSRPEATVLTVHQLHRLLSGEFEGAGSPHAGRSDLPDAELADSNFMAAVQMVGEVRQMMDTLERREHQPVPAQDRETMRAPMLSAARAQGQELGQVLGREVVNLIIANIAADKRLLPPVQQWVASLEPSLLRLALIDPRFFSNKRHPARLLLEEVVQHSFAFESEQVTGFAAFLYQAQLAVQELDQADISDPQPFAAVLGQLRQARELEDQKQHQRQESAKQALLRAEQRNQLAAELARSIANRPDAILIPDEVMAFVVGPWVQVMAHARLSQSPSGMPGVDYTALVDDLFWSVRPDLTRSNLPRLAKLIPLLLGGLRQGLGQIDYPLDATEQFFDELITLHEKCLDSANSGLPRSRRPAASSAPSRPGGLAGSDPASPWLAPEEARNSGFMDDLGEPDEIGAPSDFAATEPMSMPMELMAETPVLASDLAGQLQVGVWVELWSADRWVQVQLTWASPKGTLFLFTGVHGSTHSMTRRLLDRMFQDKQIRSLTQTSVVDQALDAVANVAMRNSIFMDIQADPES
jgi:hypothetical protein